MTDLEPQLTGAYATPRLVGRDAILDELLGSITTAGAQPQVVSILGDGGIGKTRLLQKLLERCAERPDIVVASPLLDWYDTLYHDEIAFTRAIVDRLPHSAGAFRRYEQEYQQLLMQETAGNLSGLGEQRREVLEDFIADLSAFAKGRRVVIACDTAERLLYVPGEELGLRSERADSWQWLAKSFQRWGAVTLLIAGRPDAASLISMLDSSLAPPPKTLQALTDEESVEYFDAAAEAAEAAGEPEIAQRLRSVPPTLRLEASESAGGRPILLALIADLLVLNGLDAVETLLESAPLQQSAGGGARLDMQLEALIMNSFNTPSLFGTALRYLGRLTRGVDEALLRKLLVQDHFPAQAIDRLITQLRKLSFVKMRDGRYFLHDELYAMLERQIYSKGPDGAEARRALDTVIDYLQGRNAELLRELDEAFAPVEIERRPDRLDHSAVTRITAQRRALIPDLVYSMLRRDATRGFRHYFRYTFEAIIGGDSSLDIQLQAAILNFFRDRDPEGVRPVVDSLDRELVWAVAMIRPAARFFADGDYTTAIDYAQELRTNQAAQLRLAGPATAAALNSWEATSRIYRGQDNDLAVAEALLNEAVDSVGAALEQDEAVVKETEARRWRTHRVLALAHMFRGYLHRVRGAFEAAAEDYTAAVALWRDLRVNVNLANTLNNLAFVRAEQGYIDDARALAHEALDIRRKLGSRVDVGYSLNTLALIDIRSERYTPAIERAEQALSLFRALKHQRGIVLALNALAEAIRRDSGSTYAASAVEQAHRLHEAARCAREARLLAGEINERERQVQALIEFGCATRDLLRLRVANPTLRDDPVRLARESQEALEEAVRVASTIPQPYRVVDSLVNLAYLAFYQGDLPQATKAANRAYREFPESYRLEAATAWDGASVGEGEALFWAQLGKLLTLYGLIAFQGLHEEQAPEARRRLISEMAGQFFHSLECNLRYSSTHPGLSQARNQIFSCLKGLPGAELSLVAEITAALEARFAMARPSELRRLLRNRALWHTS